MPSRRGAGTAKTSAFITVMAPPDLIPGNLTIYQCYRQAGTTKSSAFITVLRDKCQTGRAGREILSFYQCFTQRETPNPAHGPGVASHQFGQPIKPHRAGTRNFQTSNFKLQPTCNLQLSTFNQLATCNPQGAFACRRI